MIRGATGEKSAEGGKRKTAARFDLERPVYLRLGVALDMASAHEARPEQISDF